MDGLCSETFEYDLRDDKYDLNDNEDYINDIKERGYIYKNDLKYVEHNKVDIKKVSNLPNDYNFSVVESRFKESMDNNYELLDLNHLGLDTLPKFDKYKHIKYLFITNNNFIDINLSNLVNLVVLDISFNKFICIPKLPKCIEELTITNNLIKKEDLYKYKNLKRVNISNNKLNSINIVKSLETLICDNNKIKEIGNFENLKDLRCDKNKIVNIFPMKNLLIISCCNNKIIGLNDFDNLVELYCDDNYIDTIKNMPSMEVLHCIKNKLNNIPYFPKLLELECDYNENLAISKQYKINNTNIHEKYVTLCFKTT